MLESPWLAIIFTIGGIVTILGCCYDWEWYWRWGGKIWSKWFGHNNRRSFEFIIGVLTFGVGIITGFHSILEANLVVAFIVGVGFTYLFTRIIYIHSEAEFFSLNMKRHDTEDAEIE